MKILNLTYIFNFLILLGILSVVNRNLTVMDLIAFDEILRGKGEEKMKIKK